MPTLLQHERVSGPASAALFNGHFRGHRGTLATSLDRRRISDRLVQRRAGDQRHLLEFPDARRPRYAWRCVVGRRMTWPLDEGEGTPVVAAGRHVIRGAVPRRYQCHRSSRIGLRCLAVPTLRSDVASCRLTFSMTAGHVLETSSLTRSSTYRTLLPPRSSRTANVSLICPLPCGAPSMKHPGRSKQVGESLEVNPFTGTEPLRDDRSPRPLRGPLRACRGRLRWLTTPPTR